jgi:UDP-glucose 6-dehydrogenase
MKIAVIGLGHVGLPTALGFSELGWEVLGVDDDPHPDVAAATAEAEVVFVCVGTPQRDGARGSSVGSTVSPTIGSTSFPCAPTDAPEGPELASGQERGFCVK